MLPAYPQSSMSHSLGQQLSCRRCAQALAVLAVVALAFGAAPASAKRAVPGNFMGVYWGNQAAEAPPPIQDAQWQAMAANGVESVRTVFNWSETQPRRDAAPDWSALDTLVARAASNGLDLLPVVFAAPRWARIAKRPAAPPRNPADLARFMRLLVQRYGPEGQFWRDHPQLPRRPIRAWQIWNEPHAWWGWDVSRSRKERKYRFPAHYVRVLRAAYKAVKQADKGAKVVLAGLTTDSWRYLEQIYRAGGRGSFDVVASQTFTGKTSNLYKTLRYLRGVMRKYRDQRKGLWITETSWPAALGRAKFPRGQRPFATTDAGMARKVKDLFTMARKAARDKNVRLGRVYWYEWASPYASKNWIFDYGGLLRIGPGWSFQPMPALAAYRAAARSLTGR